jgi:hypothetical protein
MLGTEDKHTLLSRRIRYSYISKINFKQFPYKHNEHFLTHLKESF